MRTFVAIDIPDEIRERIRSLAEELKKELQPTSSKFRWSRPEGLHVTLKFLGEVSAAQLERVQESLAMVHLPSQFRVAIRGSGFFPSVTAPRTFWLGIEASPELERLALAVERSLEPLGFPREKHPYAPHLTLARMGGSEKAGTLQASLRLKQPLEFGAFAAEDFFLYESKSAHGGSIYAKISRFSILAPA